MFPSIRAPILSAPFVHKVTIAALICATFLATPLTATRARAQAAATPAAPVAATAIEIEGETGAHRIINLNTGG